MKYSVIIPVYKAETTLERCLDSLLDQPHGDVEILLINDGSPDNSGAICEKYAAENECVRYFLKENGGVSSARNLGLDEAEGEYILFVDSDDYVSDDYFEVIDKALSEKQPDLLLYGYKYCGRNKGYNLGSYYADKEMDIAEKTNIAVRKYLFSSLCSKSFKKSIIEKEKLRFDNKLHIGEDQAFIMRYAVCTDSMMSIPRDLYMVNLESTDSLSRKTRDYLAEELIQSNLNMIESVENSALSDAAKRLYMEALTWMYYRGAYSACKELLKYDISRRERRKKIRSICKMFNKAKLKAVGWKCRIIALPVKLRLTTVIDVLINQRAK